jgi:hypothetical protein
MKLRLLGVAMLAVGGVAVAAVSACSAPGAADINGKDKGPTASMKLRV